MAGLVCSKCQGEREADSTSLSYCKKCSRDYQRERYRLKRLEMGYPVTPRRSKKAEGAEEYKLDPDEERLRTEEQLDRSFKQIVTARQFSHCHFCNTWTEPRLPIPIYKKVSAWDPDIETKERYEETNLITGLACNDCSLLIATMYKVGTANSGKILQFVLRNITKEKPTAHKTHKTHKTAQLTSEPYDSNQIPYDPMADFTPTGPPKRNKKDNSKLDDNFDNAIAREVFNRLLDIQDKEGWDVIQDVQRLHGEDVGAQVWLEIIEGKLIYDKEEQTLVKANQNTTPPNLDSLQDKKAANE